ncbi:MAG TPA: hypothetical protein VFS67_01035 [Polyangiaceae bacterium]|nr:hypothetical protein [Polyangiaceae bacterium]
MRSAQIPASKLLLLAVAAGAGGGCAPKASSMPLGSGPLALAEQRSLAAEAKPAPPPRRSAPARSSEPLSSPPVARSQPSESASEPEEPDEAASAEGKPAAAAPHFAGVFAGKDVAIFRIAGMPDRQELDDKARIRVESESPTQLRVVLINSENGSDLCELTAEIQGNSAQLDSGQPCFTAEGEGAINAELTSGTVVLSGDRLSMEAEGTLSVALAEEELQGSLSYSFKGKRQ